MTTASGSYTPKTSPAAPQNGAALALAGETAGMVLAAQAKAMVEARYTIALRQPRDIDAVEQRLLRECNRPAFAAAAIYHKPIGDGIEGPSIRLAEACIQLLGNILIDTPAIYDDLDKRIIRVSVADMETNVAYSQDVTVQKTVERNFLKDGDEVVRQRTNSKGRTVYVKRATDDEILNTQNALVSKALRTLALRLVPGWLLDAAMEKCREVRANGGTDPRAAKKKLLDAFLSVGVDAEAVKEWLGHDGDLLQPAERDALLGFYNAIKDGEATWGEVMDARVTQREKAKPAAPPPAAKTEPAPSATAAADRTLDPGNDPPAMQGAPAGTSERRGTAGVKESLRKKAEASGQGDLAPKKAE